MTNNFVLEAIDAATGCVAKKFPFVVDELSALASILEIDVDDLEHAAYELNHQEALMLCDRFNIGMGNLSYQRFWIRCRHRNDDLPYELHTNRELLLMLAGKKPLSHFSYPNVPEEREVVEEIERYFEPHVESGKMIKRVWIEPKTKKDQFVTRHVFYSLPGEEWRLEAFINLILEWRKDGWSEVLERKEGELLGYSPAEMDFHMSRWKRE